MSYSGWHKHRRFAKSHFFSCGESYALPTYGESYGGASDWGSPYANSYCGKIRLREIKENLQEKQPTLACRVCVKVIESNEKRSKQ